MRTWIQQPNSPSGAKIYHSGRFIKAVYSKTIVYTYIPKGRNMYPVYGRIVYVKNLKEQKEY